MSETCTHTDAITPIVQSYEPGEDWYFCYCDQLPFGIEGEGPSASHP